MFRHLPVRDRRSFVVLAAVAIVAGSLFASTPASAAVHTPEPTAHVRVARPFNFRVPNTDPTTCSTSDTSIIHCWVEHLSSWRLQILCIRVGSAVVTVTGKGPDFIQPVTCTPLPPDTTDFKAGPPAVASKGPSCTTMDPAVVCIVKDPQRTGRLTYFCRRPANGTVAVRLVDTTFFVTHTCRYEASFQVLVGASRATALPRHSELGTHADHCQSSDEAVAVCWTHGPSEGFAMRCFTPGEVILTLKGVLHGDMDVPLSCRAM